MSSVQIDAEVVRFGDQFTFPRSMPVGYKSKKGGGDHYSLDAVVYFLQHIESVRESYAEYMKLAKSASITAVSVVDRLDLGDFLQGKADATGPGFVDVAAHLHISAGPGAPADTSVDGTTTTTARGTSSRIVAATDARGTVPEEEDALLAEVRAHARPLLPASAALSCSNRSFLGILTVASRVLGTAGPAAGTPARAPGLPGARRDIHASALAQTGIRSLERPAVRNASSMLAAQKASSSATSAVDPSRKRSRTLGIPVIVVPSGLQARLGMYNVQEFLEELRFVEPLAARNAKGASRSKTLVCRRTFEREGGEPVIYHVMDDLPQAAGDRARVVAVIAQGVKWQFKTWPFAGAAKGDLVETLDRMRGFYIKYKDEKVPEAVQGWNVKVLSVDRENRYEDAAVARQFWQELDQFIFRHEKLRENLKY